MSNAVLENAQSTAGAGLLLSGPAAANSENSVPGWFQAFREKGWQQFLSLPQPTRNDQAWRFTDLKRLDLSDVAAPLPVDLVNREELVRRSERFHADSSGLVFANDTLAGRMELPPSLMEAGVILAPIQEAVSEHETLFRERFMEHATPLGGSKFEALHKAYVSNGTFLFVPDNIEVELPIEVFHWLAGANASTFPHTLLVAGANSKVTLIDYFQSADAGAPGFAAAVNDIYAGPGAKVTYICVQNWGARVKSVQINSTTLERDAAVAGLNLNLGSEYARVESVSHVKGRGARSDMLAVTVGAKGQEFDLRTLQDHLSPGATSDLLFKNALSDNAHSIFAGLIRVEPGAHQTDAYQTNRNLVLSEDAVADSMPGLEILADEVKCSHGATTGYLSEEELFYLRARGIPERKAKDLLVNGFLDEVLEKLENPPLVDHLRKFVSGTLNASRG
jgi:Fe-S cluster assembly protein SufD